MKERCRDGCRISLLIAGVVLVPAIFHTLPVTSLVNHTFFSGVSKIYVAGAKIAAPKRLLAPHNPARLAS